MPSVGRAGRLKREEKPMSAMIARTPPQLPGDGSDWPARWRTLAQGVGVGRYTDAAFASMEFDKLWHRVWQVAARTDEIPAQGDYTTYKIGDQSILLVRVDESSIKAYYNFCPHRGTALGQGCGHFESGNIICPFHGWRWDLSGNIKLVLERSEFRNGDLRDGDVALREVHCKVFAGFIFISLDPKPLPFDEFIAPMRQFLEDFVLEDMRHIWWKRASVACNWKVAQEAFFEAYHVSATHPQLEKVGSEIVYGDRTEGEMFYQNLTYNALAQGHGEFFGGAKTPIAGHVQDDVQASGDRLLAMAARMNLTAEGLGAMILQDDIELLLSLREKNLGPDANYGAEYVRLQYETAAAQQRPMPRMTPEAIGKWGGVNFIFPNILILPQAGNAAIYRALPHPTDPNQCTFEIRSVKTYPAGANSPRASVEEVTDPGQVGLIPQQDLGNLPRIQEGLHCRGMQQTWLASNQEKLILNMHQQLDHYLGA
jgi:nitrite reductase/ring-hydroxylating ferredoxin subunit